MPHPLSLACRCSISYLPRPNAMEKIFYVPVPEEEFYQRVGEAVYSVLMRNNISVPVKQQQQKWLTHTEAAAYLKKTPSALYKLSSEREVKFTKRGKQNYYRIEDLDRYMEEGLVKTAGEIVKEVQSTPRKNYLLTKNK